MAYSDFSLTKIKTDFGLIEEKINLFPKLTTIRPSIRLKAILKIGIPLSITASSEKARSEFIVAPLLLELMMRNDQKFTIFSGERLDIAPEQGLNGECDFILSKDTISNTLQYPIFCLVEAKKHDIKEGLGQCVAQMLGASLFNKKEHNQCPTIYGCVTTGEIWQFLKLIDTTFYIDTKHYYISELGKLIAILQTIINA